jgi:hypothetical protein
VFSDKELFEGLQTYRRHGNQQGLSTSQTLAMFCKVRWKVSIMPKGATRVRLAQFLTHQGLLKPSDTLHATLGYLAELVGFGVLEADDAGTLAGIGGVRPSSQLFVALREECNPPADVLNETASKIELEETYGDQLRACKLLVRVIAQDSPSPTQTTTATPTSIEHLDTPKNTKAIEAEPERGAVDTSIDVVAIASMLGALAPYLRLLVSEATPEQRSRFRKLMGDVAVFDISNLLESLCSERARRKNK